MVSTVKVTNIDTPDNTGNVTFDRPIVGDGSGLTSLPAANLTGTVAVSKGGTGATTHTANNVLVGNGTSAIGSVAPSTSGNVLTSNGSSWASTAPAGGALSPMFYVYDENADIGLTANTWTKVSFPDTLFNDDTVFASDKFTVPAGQGGKYVLNSRISVYSSSNNILDARIKIYKNGGFYHGGYLFAYGSSIRHIAPHLSFIEDAAAGDYYEIYISVNATSPRIYADGENKKFQFFSGYKIG